MDPPTFDYSPGERRLILTIARAAAAESLGAPVAFGSEDDPPPLQTPRGCFVTLRTRAGRLRGCVGTFDTSTPLGETLRLMARASTQDGRFTENPVALEELPHLVLSVRILTPLEPLPNPLHLQLGTEGIFIVGATDEGQVRGCFLPEVAVDQNWGVQRLLSECCAQKMGLPADAWVPPTDLKFFKFQAVCVSE